MRQKNSLTLLSMTLIFGTLSRSFLGAYSSIKINAALNKPTNINTHNLTGAELSTYYSAIYGKSGTALFNTLNDIIDDHIEPDYENDEDRLAYKIIDRNWQLSPLTPSELANFNYNTDNGYIRKFFADYNDNPLLADRFKNDGASRVSFDKEHLWPQSLGEFGRKGGAGSDFHSLVPSDVKINQGAHSNNHYGVPTSDFTNYSNDKGSYGGRTGSMPGGTQKVFEPLDQYKGDVARAMFYMPVRYNEYVDALHPKLELVHGTPNAVTASPTQNGLAGDLATLLRWHEEDPVDEYEIHRNNLIYNNYQLNRNPFVDFPELAKLIYNPSFSGTSFYLNAANACVIGSCSYYDPDAEADLVSLSIDKSANRKDFFIGESLITSGLEISAHYDDGSSNVISSYALSIVGQNDLHLTSSGQKTVQISYTSNGISKTTSYTIQVATSLNTTLVITPSITTFKLGQTYVDNDLTAKVVFTTSNGNFEQIAPFEDLVVTAPNTNKLGVQSGNVTYKGFSSPFTIDVTNLGVIVGTNTVSPDLFFSEYVEGSSNNKAFEIFNGTGVAVDLAEYSVKLFANGGTSATSTQPLANFGALGPNETLLLYNGSASEGIKQKGESSTNVANHNGDDALVLYKNDIVIDILGKIGDATKYGENVTLVRKPHISQGNQTYDSNEWTTYPSDTFDYLGTHSISWVNNAEITANEQALAYATYFLEITAPFCQVLDGGNIPWEHLKQEYTYMDVASKNTFMSSNEAAITNARERYIYLISRYQHFADDNFMTDGSGQHLVPQSKNITGISSNVNELFIMVMGLSLLSVSAFYLFKKKEQNL